MPSMTCWSKEPAQPTQKRTGGFASSEPSDSAIVLMPIPSAHSARSLGENAHGEKLFSMLPNADCNSEGKLDSIMFNSKIGTFVSPFEFGNAWIMAKLIDIQERPDSMSGSQIMVTWEGTQLSEQVKRTKEQAKKRQRVIMGKVRTTHLPLRGGGEQAMETVPCSDREKESVRETSALTEMEMMENRPTPDRIEEIPPEEFPHALVELSHGDIVIANDAATLPASLVLGGVWAVIHFIPLTQAHRSVEWIAWWTLLKLVFIPLGGRSWCAICPVPR